MKPVKSILTAAVTAGALLGASMAQAMTLNGAGSTFIFPLISKMSYEYNKKTGTQVNYASIGSGGGIQQFTAGTVDFGATDAFLTDEEAGKISGGAYHIPAAIGAVCVSYNVPGVTTSLKLTPDVLAGIFMGEITNWNDPAIQDLNSDVTLPNLNITVAHRSDASGTSNIFTNYLSKVSTKWAGSVGWGKSVKWPVGVGGKGNEGVAGVISQVPGAVGYIELAYAMENKITYALIKNKAGNFVAPSVDGAAAAAAGAIAHMPSDFKIMITNASGAEAYPIVGFTWVIVHPTYSDSATGKAVVDFLHYMLDNQDMAASLYYAPFPDSLVKKVEARVDTIKF